MSVVSEKVDNNISIIKVQGEFDSRESSSFKEEVLQLLSDEVSSIRVDLSNVDFIDSSGIGVLLSASLIMEKLGGSLTLEKTQSHILDLFEATQAIKHLKFLK